MKCARCKSVFVDDAVMCIVTNVEDDDLPEKELALCDACIEQVEDMGYMVTIKGE